jgi:hypothetical protein
MMGRKRLRALIFLTAAVMLADAVPSLAQEEMGEIIVTASRKSSAYFVEARPVVGLRRQADSAVWQIAITSDSREADMRKREVVAMLLAAIDKAGAAGLSLVTGKFELVEVTKANYRDIVFGAVKANDEDDDEDEDENQAVFEDDDETATIRLMVKAKLAGSVGSAQQRIDKFVKSVPATGRSLIEQSGSLTLTIFNPDQYRDEILKRVADAARHHAGFFGEEYGVSVSGLDKDISWAQVSNTEVFLYIPYSFAIQPK